MCYVLSETTVLFLSAHTERQNCWVSVEVLESYLFLELKPVRWRLCFWVEFFLSCLVILSIIEEILCTLCKQNFLRKPHWFCPSSRQSHSILRPLFLSPVPSVHMTDSWQINAMLLSAHSSCFSSIITVKSGQRGVKKSRCCNAKAQDIFSLSQSGNLALGTNSCTWMACDQKLPTLISFHWLQEVQSSG